MAAMMDYKRKLLPERASPEEVAETDVDDSTISCENCGRKIETKLFVEHVRACLGQTLAADIKRYKEMKEREVEKRLDQGSKRRHQELPGSDPAESESKRQREETNGSADMEADQNQDSPEDLGIKLEAVESDECKSKESKQKSTDNDESAQETFNSEHQERDEIDSQVKDESSKSEIHSPNHWANIKVEPEDTHTMKSKKVKTIDEDNNEDIKVKRKSMSKNLDIIDPNTSKDETPSSGSALSAMESFIKKSFSNKFDYKKGNIVIGQQPIPDTLIHSRPLTSAMSMDSIDYLNKYKKFYNALNLQNGLKQDGQEGEGGKSKYAYEKASKSKKDGEDYVRNSDSPLANGTELKDDGRSSVKSYLSDNSSSLDTNENIEKKYLNMTEESDEKAEKGKSSALDNLSSFVYGQPMTSEHPLDSLQRLITKADIPKLMVSQGARAFKYLPPHLQLHPGQADFTLPLNLSLKTMNGGEGENESEEGEEEDEKLRPEEDSLSDYEAMCSPANSDGEPVDYRCAACSRRFASKGSYRYHLSRCHLSSVKRYGIKEAFNMSPYVYLPLDHTAKFSKYYEMAKELANKRK